LEDNGTDGSIIFKWIFKKWDEEAWAGLLWRRTEDRDRWWALVNAVMILQVPYNVRYFLTN
jgi:hypothetical protein